MIIDTDYENPADLDEATLRHRVHATRAYLDRLRDEQLIRRRDRQPSSPLHPPEPNFMPPTHPLDQMCETDS